MADNLDISLSCFSEAPPWETEASTLFPREEPEQELEVYKKAENFKKLNLLSGNTIKDNLVAFIEEYYGKEGIQRYKLTKFVSTNLGLKPSPDMLLALSCTTPARLIIATAGAGKTTSLQIDLIVSKLLDTILGIHKLDPVKIPDTDLEVPAILYLNYNKHNVAPIYERHMRLVAKVNNMVQETIRDDIESSTVHAFCNKWLLANKDFLGNSSIPGVPDLKVMSDAEKEKIWEAVITPRITKFYGESATDVHIEFSQLDELYTYKVESMLSWEEFFQSAKFIDSKLREDFVKSCITKYSDMKNAMKKMDFTDQLLKMIELLHEHPEVQEELQSRYKIIVADENQDFTALMNELLLMLHNPKKNRLIVVGDPDQTIYAFKGVSPDNVVGLYERLPEAQILGLDTNYRCPDKIVDAAKRILDMNVMRFKKPILTVRTGGEIIKVPDTHEGEQEQNVISVLKKLGSDAWPNTVIAYRNNSSSWMISEELYYEGIQFRMLDGTRPFNYPAFKHLRELFEALSEKNDTVKNECLYRFLPLNRKQWVSIIEANREHRKHHIMDLLLPPNLPYGTVEAFEVLREISTQIDTMPTSYFITRVVQLYRKYYYDFMMKTTLSLDPRKYSDLDTQLSRAVKFFSRDYTFEYEMKEFAERNVDCIGGLCLGTFHALKGLEFDYVLAIDFDDDIFPNFQGIEGKYPPNTAIEAKESENRLAYVLVTRVIKKLYLFYMKSCPSVYIRVLCPNESVSQDTMEQGPEIKLGNISGGGSVLSRMDFIKKLTERG